MTEQLRKGIITFSISDRGALYSSYLSFTRNGGLFVPTALNYDLGDEVFMLLKIMDDPGITPVSGTVVWITPTGSQGNKAPGVGIQFSGDDSSKTRSNIENHLTTTLKSERPTQTM